MGNLDRAGTRIFNDMEELLIRIASLGEGSGLLVPAAAFAGTFVVAILPFPAEVPAAFNGMVFGPFWGSVTTWTAAMAGAWVSYELGLRWGRPLVERLVPRASLERADAAMATYASAGLIALRLMPFIAFTAVNWSAGLAGTRRTTYLWTTAVGIVPGVILFTTSGSALVDMVRGALSPARLTLIGLAAGVLVAAAAWRRRHRRAT